MNDDSGSKDYSPMLTKSYCKKLTIAFHDRKRRESRWIDEATPVLKRQIEIRNEEGECVQADDLQEIASPSP